MISHLHVPDFVLVLLVEVTRLATVTLFSWHDELAVLLIVVVILVEQNLGDYEFKMDSEFQ